MKDNTDPKYPNDGVCWGCHKPAKWIHYGWITKNGVEYIAYLKCTRTGTTLKNEKDINLNFIQKLMAIIRATWDGYKAMPKN